MIHRAVRRVRHFLSYFIPLSIERRAGADTPELGVMLWKGRALLNSSRVNYSFGALHEVLRLSFEQVRIRERAPKNALILGFGTGSAASILLEEYQLACTITGVECDREVLALGKKYFNTMRFSPMELVQEKAEDFIAHATGSYELILADVFIDDRVPAPCREKAFLQQLEKRLAKNGVILFNFILREENKTQFRRLHEDFREVFGSCSVMEWQIEGAMNKVLTNVIPGNSNASDT